MFWDKVAGVYDIFTNIINRKTHQTLCAVIADLIRPTDEVLECACGTGMLSGVIAGKCKSLIATDFSLPMLKRAEKKCARYRNVTFQQGNILQIDFAAERFDVVVAANVIHLLEEPYKALHELDRVCKKGGRIIIPTYMNENEKGETNAITAQIGKAGADFKREFTLASYQKFFADAGYQNVTYTWCDGKVPCAVAVIIK
ncbi:MAG TPA: SAM-dependent methyltransferase [Lachnospiraceae bacterium]|jgi:methionine biosynthesis protein metW|nr:SAM-dependent methyltransferase [Lachnospiraceae bacterium]HCX42424.1 SAM-dependent methyltransferase [Lachnospiraceae bacterium]